MGLPARRSPAATSDFSVVGREGEMICAVCLLSSRSLSFWNTALRTGEVKGVAQGPTVSGGAGTGTQVRQALTRPP